MTYLQIKDIEALLNFRYFTINTLFSTVNSQAIAYFGHRLRCVLCPHIYLFIKIIMNSRAC